MVFSCTVNTALQSVCNKEFALRGSQKGCTSLILNNITPFLPTFRIHSYYYFNFKKYNSGFIFWKRQLIFFSTSFVNVSSLYDEGFASIEEVICTHAIYLINTARYYYYYMMNAPDTICWAQSLWSEWWTGPVNIMSCFWKWVQLDFSTNLYICS
jgi:hypothetical protein